MTTWDDFFMQVAELMSTRSKDPSTKVGAVIVDHSRRLLGTGYNGFPRGVADHPSRYEDKAVKYKLVVHAEANAILNAVKSVQGMTLYATKFPCSECAKLIVQSGISHVVTNPPSTDGKWAEDAEFSKIILTEGCVLVRQPHNGRIL